LPLRKASSRLRITSCGVRRAIPGLHQLQTDITRPRGDPGNSAATGGVANTM
jgi:hypothetical protein